MSESDGGIVTPLSSWGAAGVARRAAAASVARLRRALTIISSDVAARLCPCSGRRGPHPRDPQGVVRPWERGGFLHLGSALARSTSDTPRRTSWRALLRPLSKARQGSRGGLGGQKHHQAQPECEERDGSTLSRGGQAIEHDVVEAPVGGFPAALLPEEEHRECPAELQFTDRGGPGLALAPCLPEVGIDMFHATPEQDH